MFVNTKGLRVRGAEVISDLAHARDPLKSQNSDRRATPAPRPSRADSIPRRGCNSCSVRPHLFAAETAQTAKLRQTVLRSQPDSSDSSETRIPAPEGTRH